MWSLYVYTVAWVTRQTRSTQLLLPHLQNLHHLHNTLTHCTQFPFMDPTPTLMGIPPELRIKIIKFVADSFSKQLRIPCCSDCLEDGFSPSVDREDATDENVTLVPAGARDVLALSRINKHVHAEVVATFFPHVVAHFCQTCA